MIFIMFSNSTKYAIRTVEFLFLHRNIGKTSVAELAMELNIPRSYLSKVLQQLSKSKIISSTKGRGGGFYMSKENIKRPLIDIIICIEGYNVFDECILGLHSCKDEAPCLLHKYFRDFKKSIEGPVTKNSIKKLFNISEK